MYILKLYIFYPKIRFFTTFCKNCLSDWPDFGLKSCVLMNCTLWKKNLNKLKSIMADKWLKYDKFNPKNHFESHKKTHNFAKNIPDMLKFGLNLSHIILYYEKHFFSYLQRENCRYYTGKAKFRLKWAKNCPFSPF